MIDRKVFDSIPSEEFFVMVEDLTEKEQMVLMLLRGADGVSPEAYEEVAHELGITVEKVQQTEAKALETLERLYSGWRQEHFVIVRKDGSREEF